GDGGEGDVHDAVRLGHVNFKAEAEGLVAGRHETLQLGGLQALIEFEGGAQRGPGGLQLAAENADDALHDALLDFGDLALLLHASDAAQQQVDDGKDQRGLQIERGSCAHRLDLKGRQVGQVRDALQKLAEGELLDGDQVDFKDDAQVSAQRVGEVAGKAFVEIADGAHLVFLDLSGLLEVAALEGGGQRRRSLAASQRGAKHGIDFFLIQHLFHVPSS